VTDLPNYWLDLFSFQTWQEFIDAGSKVAGFRRFHWTSVQKIEPGDFLLCYLVRVSRWVGLLEVTSEPFLDSSRIWKGDLFPARVRVKPNILLSPEAGVPVESLRDRLSVFKNLKDQRHWGVAFRKCPLRWTPEDGELIIRALRDSAAHPVVRPIDPKKLIGE